MRVASFAKRVDTIRKCKLDRLPSVLCQERIVENISNMRTPDRSMISTKNCARGFLFSLAEKKNSLEARVRSGEKERDRSSATQEQGRFQPVFCEKPCVGRRT